MADSYEFIDHVHDVLVVGAGGAGLRATLGMGLGNFMRHPPPRADDGACFHHRAFFRHKKSRAIPHACGTGADKIRCVSSSSLAASRDHH